MKFNINIDYKLRENDRKDAEGNAVEVNNREITFNYISYAVNKKYDKGLEGQLRRLWGRIQRKFDAAIDDKKNEVELETSELDFITKAINECNFLPAMSRYIEHLEDEIEKVSKE